MERPMRKIEIKCREFEVDYRLSTLNNTITRWKINWSTSRRQMRGEMPDVIVNEYFSVEKTSLFL